jgi:hypothetical protein
VSDVEIVARVERRRKCAFRSILITDSVGS